MKLLNTYEDRESAEKAAQLITGSKRLASERDSTEVIYNLFGEPSWGNFYRLGMFNLPVLQQLLDARKAGLPYDQNKHAEIISMLKYAAKQFEIEIPQHWL
ncbi:hypothetical protein [Thalassolituus marinus]|uniref:Uncharacterized protein n=1 Tax=Thalassolituus marinus TaxID=671053 RepID=A0ABS7ZS05_9GAMM|nr:hypothetical protein [Thalassolituus marinus]MCA6064543.1 hypothetical protein [Thalassolituus marinus]